MPVRFLCLQCRQLLSIGSRKAGTEIKCPKCGQSQLVPCQSQLEVQPELVGAGGASMTAGGGASRFEDEAWVANVLASVPSETPETPAVWKPPAAEVPTPEPEPAPVSVEPVSAPRRMEAPPVVKAAPSPPIVAAPAVHSLPNLTPKVSPSPITPSPITPLPISNAATQPRTAPSILRRVVVLGILVQLVLLAGVFAIGYLVGGYQSTSSGKMAVSIAGALGHQPVRIKGRAVYESASGDVLGDGQTVVIIVPEDKPIVNLPKVEQLGPEAAPPDDAHAGVAAIRQAGGQYARCHAGGSFDLAVNRPGVYRVLMISNHANRATSGAIDDVDAREMNAAMGGIEKAVGAHRYYWLKVDVPLGGSNLQVHFGGTPVKKL